MARAARASKTGQAAVASLLSRSGSLAVDLPSPESIVARDGSAAEKSAYGKGLRGEGAMEDLPRRPPARRPAAGRRDGTLNANQRGAFLMTDLPQPIVGHLGATIAGPRNPEAEAQNPDILIPPITDNGPSRT